MGGSASHYSHVANGSDQPIWARMEIKRENENANLWEPNPMGASNNIETNHIFDGFIKISPGSYFRFNAQRDNESNIVYLSIKDESGNFIANKVGVPEWHGIIVKRDMTVANAKYKSIWTDEAGKAHSH